MVVLKNIKQQGNVLSCNYYPESNDDEKGYIEMNIDNGELLKIDYSPCKYWKAGYVAHARDGLLKIAQSGKPIPEKYTVMWY